MIIAIVCRWRLFFSSLDRLRAAHAFVFAARRATLDVRLLAARIATTRTAQSAMHGRADEQQIGRADRLGLQASATSRQCRRGSSPRR